MPNLAPHPRKCSPGARLRRLMSTKGRGETRAGASEEMVGMTFLIDLDFLKGRERLRVERVEAVLHYT